MNRAGSYRTPQQGQALVEFLAMALAISSLFLLMPVIAKYQDIAHATHMASRYAAFDATVHNEASGAFKPEEQLADEVRRRYFSDPHAPIKTNDAAGDVKAHRNPFWSTPRGQPLINDLSDVSVSFGERNAASHSEAFKRSHDGQPFSQVPLADHARLDLKARGIYRVNIAVPLVNLPEGIQSYTPLDKIDLRIERHTSVLIDPWAARSVQQTMDRFGRLAPLASLFSQVETLLDSAMPLLELSGVRPPRFGRLQPWQDVVPADRLKPEARPAR